jgi:dihydrolipoamide dehydrogenase
MAEQNDLPFDVLVVGAGPGGYVAAIRAAHHGLRVGIVEKDDRLGGTCLLRGCIPTKSLLHSADLLRDLRNAKEFGILAKEIGFDFSGVQRARGKAVSKSAAGVDYLMRSNKVTVLRGTARFVDPHTLQIHGAGAPVTVKAHHIVLATGSVPRPLPTLPVQAPQVVTSDEILEFAQPPKSMAVLGAGAVGVEFASVFQTFGTDVTVIEMQDVLLPSEDTDVSAEFTKIYKKRGIQCLTQTKLAGATLKNGGVELTLESKGAESTLQVDTLLVAIGRAPVSAELNLAAAGVEVEAGGYIAIDTLMRTSCKHIFAIGDVVRTPWLAHVASAEGILASDVIANKDPQPLDYLQTPSCTYSNPEVGSVGLTERGAKARGYTVKTGKFPFSAVPKARLSGHTDGFVKIVSDAKYDEILGIHILGTHATDLIAEACVAKRLECTTEELARTIHAHPTLSEGVLEAAHATLGKAMHL